MENETHTLISLFDNARGQGSAEAEHPTNKISRGLLLALRTDTTPMTAELIAHYDHPRGGFSNSRGSMQFLSNGNVFMGWTYQSRQSEHSEDGRLLMEASFRNKAAHSYRNFKFPWVGRPATPPDVYGVATNINGTKDIMTTAYVSWNGATEVASWRLYKSTADGKVKSFRASAKREGFETVISVPGYVTFIVLEARDKYDKILEFSTTPVVTTSKAIDMEGPDIEAEKQWLQNPSGNSYTSSSFLHRMLYLIGALITIIIFGLFIFAIAFWFIRQRKSDTSPFWWSRKSWLYAVLHDQPHDNDGISEGSQRLANELELEANDGHNPESEMLGSSKPLMAQTGR